MPIYLNGGQNPEAVFYNGTSLTSVWAGNNGNYQEVWSSSPTPAYPTTIGVQRLILSNGNGLYFRNMTYKSGVWYVKDGVIIAVGILYEGDVTFETSFSSGRQIGPEADPNQNYSWRPDESTLSYSFTGDLPSNFGFLTAQSLSSTSSIAFNVYQNESGQLRPEDLVVMNLRTRINYSDYEGTGVLSARFTTEATGHLWPVLTRSNGWIYQNTGELAITMDY